MMALMRSNMVRHVVRHVGRVVLFDVVSGVVHHVVFDDFRAGQPERVLTATDRGSEDLDRADEQ